MQSGAAHANPGGKSGNEQAACRNTPLAVSRSDCTTFRSRPRYMILLYADTLVAEHSTIDVIEQLATDEEIVIAVKAVWEQDKEEKSTRPDKALRSVSF